MDKVRALSQFSLTKPEDSASWTVWTQDTFIQVCAQSCSQRQSLYIFFLYMYVYVYRKPWFIRPGRTRLICSSAGAFLAHAGKMIWNLRDVPELWDCLICLDFNLLRQNQFSMCTQQNRALILVQVAEWHCEQIKRWM